ncbi:hypothetical protein K440DRAFT_629873 [Wilcoxina mikolae CBS 423.85]|nr:hypothetical protein K440DRAFT_629873 [Wilcoxina mikolae CBS 423.85]
MCLGSAPVITNEQKLPFDVLYQILFQVMDVATLRALSQTCTTMSKLVFSHRPLLMANILRNNLGSCHTLAVSLFLLQNPGFMLNIPSILRIHKNVVLRALGENPSEKKIRAYYAYLVVSLRVRAFQTPFPDEDELLAFEKERDGDVEKELMEICRLSKQGVEMDVYIVDVARRWVVQAWLERNKVAFMVRRKWARDLMRGPWRTRW